MNDQKATIKMKLSICINSAHLSLYSSFLLLMHCKYQIYEWVHRLRRPVEHCLLLLLHRSFSPACRSTTSQTLKELTYQMLNNIFINLPSLSIVIPSLIVSAFLWLKFTSKDDRDVTETFHVVTEIDSAEVHSNNWRIENQSKRRAWSKLSITVYL